MKRKLYWGIATLIIIAITTTVYLLLRNTDTKPIVIYKYTEPARKTQTETAEKPTARPGYKMVKHDDHWHEVPISETSDTGQHEHVAVKPKQVKRSQGRPLNINWEDPKYLDWTDPRTAESYRNYYGFDPPTETDYFKPVQDNFGNWIKHYRNTSVVVKYGKRVGFRPTVEELARYKRLQAELALSRTLSLGGEPTLRMQSIQQEIRELVDSARGEIPTLVPREGIYYGDKQTPEMRRIRCAEADRALYRSG